MNDTTRQILNAALAGDASVSPQEITAVFAILEGKIASALDRTLIRAETRSVASMVYPDVEPPMPYAVAASLLGIGVPALKYHIRKGRIRRAMIPGSKYSLGVIAADVRAILNTTTAEGSEATAK